jgi:hypothetical protein
MNHQGKKKGVAAIITGERGKPASRGYGLEKYVADEVAVLIYRTTKGFRKEEIHGLTSQIRERRAPPTPVSIVCHYSGGQNSGARIQNGQKPTTVTGEVSSF